MDLPRGVRLLGPLLLVTLLAACASRGHRAPVEDRAGMAPGTSVATAPGTAASGPMMPADTSLKPPPPGQENLGKPGYYVVKPGDTLIRIGLENGQNWRDIARWNGLENPNVIEVGQVVRVVPPTANANGVVVRPVLASGAAVPAASAPLAAASGASASAPVSPPPSVAARDPDEDLNWMWPAAGPVITNFDEAKYKGLAIAGKAGDPVLAAADGRVVYAGSGLRGYGNLIIVKHNNTYLSAYAHNQTLLVKEDQVVHRGQKIAEMGSSDADRVELHFEIRRQGKPVDPAKMLPPR